MHGLTLEGTALETEHRKGSFTNDSGQAVEYDFHVTSVLIGTKVVELRFNNDNADARPPADGSVISLTVELPKGAMKLVAKKYVDSKGVRAVS